MGSSHSHSKYAHHHHHRPDDISGAPMIISIILNLIITIAEIIGGIFSNSLALISDALHNLSDTLSLIIAFAAYKVGLREHNIKKTFGYKRIEILAALFNAVALVVICIYLFYEAYLRFMNPQPIKGGLMLVVAIIGLLANLISVLLLKGDVKKNINIKAAYLHLLGDTLSSVGVIIGGLLIWLYNLYWIDPVVTVIIALYLLKETYAVLKEAVEILMQAAPESLNIDEARKDILSLEGVENVHHIHVWRMDDHTIHFECHITIKQDLHISKTDEIRNLIEEILCKNYKVSHVTIQVEYYSCEDRHIISQHSHKK